MHQIVMTLYFVVGDFTHFTIWCITCSTVLFRAKVFISYRNKCIQHRMADIKKNTSWLWILILQPKQVKMYCFRSFSTVAIHPLTQPIGIEYRSRTKHNMQDQMGVNLTLCLYVEWPPSYNNVSDNWCTRSLIVSWDHGYIEHDQWTPNYHIMVLVVQKCGHVCTSELNLYATVPCGKIWLR